MIRSRIVRNVLLGIKTLLLHKLRAFLTMLGVVFGVGSVIAMLAVGEGASREALDQIRKLGSQNILLSSVKPVEDDTSRSTRVRLSVHGLLYADAERIAESFDGVRRVVPAKVIRDEGRMGMRALDMRIVGTTPDWFELVRRPLLSGRVLEPADERQHANVAVLTEHGARRLLAGEAAIGSSLRLGGGVFTVIGIVRSEGGMAGALHTPDAETDAYIPLTTARERFGDYFMQRTSGSRVAERVELHQILVEAETLEQVVPVSRGIEALLRRFHKRQDWRVDVPLALLEQAEATRRRFNLVLGSIAGISLLVGGIGIMNIMLASVTERTREIGIRRAIGARRQQIVGQFLIEAVVLSTVGGLIGVGVGVGIPQLITLLSGMRTIVPLYAVLLSLGISMAVGIVFGLYPALRAARLDPIVALRHE